jgi:hypothetical protein
VLCIFAFLNFGKKLMNNFIDDNVSYPTGKITGIKLGEDYLNSAEKMGKSGWIIPMDLPPYTPIEICKEIDKIDELLFSYYSNDIRFTNMVAELISTKLAYNHRNIILQSYCAYKTNLYSVCISSLNPLVEGFLSNLSIDKKNVNMLKIIKDIKEKYYDLNNHSLFNQTIEMFYISLEAFCTEYTKNISFTDKQEIYTRHSVAHGRIQINDDQLEVIKMFSNLYNIAVFFSQYMKDTPLY